MDTITLDTIRKQFGDRKAGTVGRHSFCAVLVPVVEKEGELYLLYEVRADNLDRQPGEVCFPGGMMEPGENRQECALRETEEELGICSADIEIVNELDTLYTYSSFTMYCYLGIIAYDKVKNARISEEEVKEIFLVPLKYLLETEPYIYDMEVKPMVGEDFPYEKLNCGNHYDWRKGSAHVPIYHFEDWIIWGLTGRITHNLINVLKGEKR